MARDYETKDSGERQVFESGMQRDTSADKPRFDLVYKGPMLARWAGLLMRGAIKYTANNWMKANSQDELDRGLESAARHFAQWMNGETDEDHGAAVIFNINLVEYVKDLLAAPTNTAEAVAASLRRQLEDVPALTQELPGGRDFRGGSYQAAPTVVIPLDEPYDQDTESEVRIMSTRNGILHDENIGCLKMGCFEAHGRRGADCD